MHRLKTHITFIFLVFSFSIISCNTTVSNEVITEEKDSIKEEIKITAKDIESIKYTEYALSDLAEKATRDWAKFEELKTQIELLKKADFSFFDDENALLSTFFTDFRNQIPKDLAVHAIQVRMTVFETTSFKLEGISKLQRVEKATKIEYIKDVLVSYSNLILQINKKLERDSQKIEKP